METLLAIAIGVIVAASVYLFLSRDLPRMLLGFILFGTGANLLLLLSGRVGSIMPALIDTANGILAEGASNSLPQALILTAIVIGFGLAAFTLMLALQAYRRFGTLDAESLTAAEFIDPAVLPACELPGDDDSVEPNNRLQDQDKSLSAGDGLSNRPPLQTAPHDVTDASEDATDHGQPGKRVALRCTVDHKTKKH